MKWNRNVDYHGSRSYESESPAISQIGLTFAWLVASLKARFRPSGHPRTGDLPAGDHGFSVLGSAAPLHRAAECPFPTKAAEPDYARDWRVLP